jgi:hypothetical protein
MPAMPARIVQPLITMMDLARQVVGLAALRLPEKDIKVVCDRMMSGPMRVQRRPLVHHMAVPLDRMAPRVDQILVRLPRHRPAFLHPARASAFFVAAMWSA